MKFRRTISPNLDVTTDDSACIVLEISASDDAGHVTVHKATVSNVDALKAGLDDARTFARVQHEVATASWHRPSHYPDDQES